MILQNYVNVCTGGQSYVTVTIIWSINIILVVKVRGHQYLAMLKQVYKTYSFRSSGGGCQWKKALILYTFNILAFSWHIIHLKNVDVYTF